VGSACLRLSCHVPCRICCPGGVLLLSRAGALKRVPTARRPCLEPGPHRPKSPLSRFLVAGVHSSVSPSSHCVKPAGIRAVVSPSVTLARCPSGSPKASRPSQPAVVYPGRSPVRTLSFPSAPLVPHLHAHAVHGLPCSTGHG
jgi:hypothetical protein